MHKGKDTSDTWEKRINLFFSDYLEFPKDNYKSDGFLKRDSLLCAAKVLLEEEVFDNPSDIRQQAMKDFHIIIPEQFFE